MTTVFIDLSNKRLYTDSRMTTIKGKGFIVNWWLNTKVGQKNFYLIAVVIL